MRLPLFVGAIPRVGLRSSKVLLSPGTWTLCCEEDHFQFSVHVAGEESTQTFSISELTHVHVELKSFETSTSLTAFIQHVTKSPEFEG